MATWKPDHDYMQVDYNEQTQELTFVNLEDQHTNTGFSDNVRIQRFAHWLLAVTKFEGPKEPDNA
jgi:hypothetical protein